MIRLARLLLVASTLVGAVVFTAFVIPQHAFACSCRQLEGEQFFTGREEAVVMGTVGADHGDGSFSFVVERWFHGGVEPVIAIQSGVQPLGGGNFAVSTCGLELATGQRWILSADRTEVGLSPSACGTHADPASPEGQQMFAAAVQIFGQGTSTGPPAPVTGFFDWTFVAILVVTPLVAFVLIVAVVAVFRRREGGTEAS